MYMKKAVTISVCSSTQANRESPQECEEFRKYVLLDRLPGLSLPELEATILAGERGKLSRSRLENDVLDGSAYCNTLKTNHLTGTHIFRVFFIKMISAHCGVNDGSAGSGKVMLTMTVDRGNALLLLDGVNAGPSILPNNQYRSRRCPPPESRRGPPEEGRSSFGRASFTVNARPPMFFPFISAIAFFASSALLIVTKPNPLDRPVSLSMMIATSWTSPATPNISFKSFSEVS